MVSALMPVISRLGLNPTDAELQAFYKDNAPMRCSRRPSRPRSSTWCSTSRPSRKAVTVKRAGLEELSISSRTWRAWHGKPKSAAPAIS